MTIRDALDLGLLKLEPIGGDKGDRAVTLDGRFTLWVRPGGSKPYRYAPAEKPSKADRAAGRAGFEYGGCDSLEGAMRATVHLRARSREPAG